MTKKQPKLTPWFPPSVKPARNGVYQVRAQGLYFRPGDWSANSFPAQWSGRRWITVEGPRAGSPLFEQKREWRGLASDPKDPA